MKKCFKCNKEKNIGSFYRHPMMGDGHLGKCIDCTKADVRANYKLKRKQYSDYEKIRNRRPERKAATAEVQRRRRAANPEKNRAYNAVRYALKSGKIKKMACFYCGKKKVEAHHDDYSKLLDVKWMCFKCHREKEHGQIVTAE